MLVSCSFQFVGFLLTYLLHTTHAAKNGSRAGLGITLIQYSFYLRSRAEVLTTELANGEIPPELLEAVGANGQFGGTAGTDASKDWSLWGPPIDAPAASSVASAAQPSASTIPNLFGSPVTGNITDMSSLTEPQREGLQEAMRMSSVANDWLSYLLLVLGWALLVAACINYWKAVSTSYPALSLQY